MKYEFIHKIVFSLSIKLLTIHLYKIDKYFDFTISIVDISDEIESRSLFHLERNLGVCTNMDIFFIHVIGG